MIRQLQQLIEMVGPFIFPLVLLAVIILTLAIVNALRLRRADAAQAGRLRGSVNAILFWGALAAVLGLLGQWTGLFRTLRSLSELGLSPACADNPAICYALGFAESLTTSIFGLTTLLAAGLLWFFLHSRLERLTAA